MPQAIESLRAGAERLSKLASSLQNFCHIDEIYPKPVNLHELIDNILLLLKSRLVSDIQVIKHYGQLPPVLCFAGQINQVLMNILSDSVDALINEAVSQQLDLDFNPQPISSLSHPPAEKPTIKITTQVCSGLGNDSSRWVSICIANNGPGLSIEAQKQILESFSVKKRAEKETSLAMSYQIITSKHGGRFEIRSCQDLTETSSQSALAEKQNTGTEFEILLPL